MSKGRGIFMGGGGGGGHAGGGVWGVIELLFELERLG